MEPDEIDKASKTGSPMQKFKKESLKQKSTSRPALENPVLGNESSSHMSCDSTSPRRKARVRDEKICRVCGDRALGYNFNAMTCESCKAFFRRNALKKTPPCLFQGNCSIDVRTRRFCQACRLIKCFNIGMKAEMILGYDVLLSSLTGQHNDVDDQKEHFSFEDETERKARMQKVIQNREKKQTCHQKQPVVSSPCQVKEEPVSDYCDTSDNVPSEEASSSANTSHIREAILQDLADTNFLKIPKFSTLGPEAGDPSNLRILSLDEHTLLEDLGNAYTTTLGDMKLSKIAIETEYNTCTDLINHSEEAVRRLIKFIKRLDDFQQLSQEDQISALKACVLSSILFRSASFYSIEKGAWKTSTGEISTSILEKSTGYSEIHAVHTQFCRAAKELMGERPILFALMQTICIFNPDGRGIQRKTLMSDIQDKYLLLLKHYLEMEFSYSIAQTRFAHLMMTLANLKKLIEVHNTILLQANPAEIEPLMLEVLDLKENHAASATT